ncbi:glycosyltransferase family 92 protein [Maridesulfovibrio sp.]|uniref:glycosyltransferase family 92 protein n=1 Tax=Maridesulfovibrio sp. TaxID=2795000 RepID=UPI0039F04B39
MNNKLFSDMPVTHPLIYNALRLVQINLRRYPGYFIYTNYKSGIIRKKYHFSDAKVDLPRKAKLGMLAIMRAEDKFICEWICYYKLMGVDHFYLYDNGDYEKSCNILDPFIKEGSVTVIPFPEIKGLVYNGTEKNKEQCMQYLAYGDFLVRYMHNVEWVIKVDIDEFVYPKQISGFNSILEYINSIPDVGNIRIPSYYFGSSGHISAPDDLVISSYGMRMAEPTTYKSMARSECILRQNYSTAHDFNVKITDKKNLFNEEVLVLNHYYTKSREDFINKVKNYNNGYMDGFKDLDLFNNFNSQPMVQDSGEILRYSKETKDLLKKYNRLDC